MSPVFEQLDDTIILVRVLQRNGSNKRYKNNYKNKRLFIRNWLMQLWRLRRTKIFSSQAGDTGNQRFSSYSESKAKEEECLSIKTDRKKNSPLLSIFMVCRYSTECMWPIDKGKCNLIYSISQI